MHAYLRYGDRGFTEKGARHIASETSDMHKSGWSFRRDAKYRDNLTNRNITIAFTDMLARILSIYMHAYLRSGPRLHGRKAPDTSPARLPTCISLAGHSGGMQSTETT